jgi:hypothetical protein
MPERGWRSITVREETARMVRMEAERMGLTVDEYIRILIDASRGRDLMAVCRICGAKLKMENYASHMQRMHPGAWI